MQEKFYEIDGNPVPAGASVGSFVTRDKVKIRYATFTRTRFALKGTVIILNGRNECIEKYFETISDLNKRGFMVATFDWRGQGASDRLVKDPHKGYVRDFNDYVADLEQFFTDVALPDCRAPFFILAHSTGALIALMAAPRLLNRIQRMVLSAPLLEFTGQAFAHSTIKFLSGFLRYSGFGSSYMVGSQRPRETQPFFGNKLSSDPDRYRRNSRLYEEHPELGLGGPTATWVNAASRAMDGVRDPHFQSSIQIPVLILAAGNDQVVSTPAIERYVERLRAGALITIDGAKHEIMQEKDAYREQFLAAFDAFIPGSDPARS
jgi:lysophospholipase